MYTQDAKKPSHLPLPAPLPPPRGYGLARSNSPALQAATPAMIAGPPGVSDLLRGLQRHLLPALLGGLILGGLVAVAVWFLAPISRYSVRVLLHVSSSTPTIVFETRDKSGGSSSEFATYQQTQEMRIRSRPVIAAALGMPGIGKLKSVAEQRDDPVAWLADQLRIRYQGEIMTISLEGDNDKEIVALLNAVTEAYMSQVVNVDKDKRKLRLDALRTVYDQYKQELEDRQGELNRLAEQAGSNDKVTLAYKQQLALQQQATAEQDLAEVRRQIWKMQAELEVQRTLDHSAGPVADPVAEIEAAMLDDETAGRYQAEIDRLEAQLQGYLRTARNPKNDPAIRPLQANLEARRQALEAYRQSLRATLLARQRDALRDAPGADPARALAVRLEVLKGQEELLKNKVDQLLAGADEFNKTTLNLNSIQDGFEQTKIAFAEVASEIERLKVEKNAPDRVELVEPAEVAQKIDTKKRIMYSGASGLGAMALVVMAFAWSDARHKRVADPSAIARGLGLELVGVLPALPARAADRDDEAWDHLMTESIDAARTFLLHASRTEQLRTLMVASALKGEGKTSLACHLATSLARARRRTLLIDGDLRSPAAHVLFDQAVGPGVCEVLRGELPAEEALLRTVLPDLDLLPAGRCDAESLQALGGGHFHEILDRLRDRYDLIIVDSAPVLPVSDSLQIAQHVDAAIFSVLRDVSRLPKIYEAYKRLERLGIRILGAVVAGTEPEDYESYQYGYGRQPMESAASGDLQV